MPLLHFSHTLTGEGTELRMGFCIVLLLIGFCALGDSLLGKVVEIPSGLFSRASASILKLLDCLGLVLTSSFP